VILREWQRDLLRKIYDNPHGTRRAIITFGRKNGKTALAAMLLLLHLVGPEARPNSQLYSAAQSRDQAALLFNLAAKMVRFSPTISKFVIPRDAVKELACPQLGTLYRALSAEATTAWGLSPVFVVHDELGQVKGPTSALYEATETATGAQQDPLSIIISTQAPTEADLLSVLIDDALEGHDPHTVAVVYAADTDLDPFSEEAIRQANPAFGDFQNAQETLAMAHDAKRMPSRENAYRNLVLNQRVEAFNPIVSRAIWAVMIAQVGGIWHVKPTFWLPSGASWSARVKTGCPTTSSPARATWRPPRAARSNTSTSRSTSSRSARGTT
jgi:phage terminase large subunit-like protein